jgi:P4 family phage/plasmid primase-like protien
MEHEDASAVRRPGISASTLAALGIRHVTEAEAKKLVGHSYAGLYIPYGIRVDGYDFGRLRMDQPVGNQKYTQRVGSGVQPYVPALPGLEDQPDLVLVEGEFKAISLAEAGVRAIGLSGFYGFASKEKLCPAIARILRDHPPQRVLFLGDNDTTFNAQFSDAAVKLAALVAPLPVALPRIALSMPKGVDDCREKLGEEFPAWWASLVAGAIEVPAKLQAGMLAVELVKAAAGEIKTASGVDRSLMLQGVGRLAAALQGMALAELADVCKARAGINKSVVHRAASEAMRSNETTLTAKEEWKVVTKSYGAPIFFTNDGRHVSGLNERFWAGLVRQQHLLLFEPGEQRFYRYDDSNGLWTPQSRAVLAELVCDTIHAETGGDSDYMKHAPLSFANAVVGHLAGMVEKRDAFGTQPTGIHVANGFLVLGDERVELRGFSPQDYSRNQSPIAYDPEADCPMFTDRVLKPALPEEDIALLRYFVGQCLLGRNLMQLLLILHGPGGASKGTLSNVVQGLIGESNCYELRTDCLNERFELFRYIGRSLLYGADVEPEFLRRQGAEALKKLVGGDLLSPEGKGSNEQVNLRGNFNVIITCNKRLSVRLAGDVSAWRRRLRILEFQAPAPNRGTIVNFDRLLLEQEGPGILNWAVAGAAEVLQDKRENRTRKLSVEQQQRVDSLLGQSDSVRLFLEARVERKAGSSLEKNDLVERYADFCAERGWEPLPDTATRKELKDRMMEMFGSTERQSAGSTKNQRGYSNVAFQGEAEKGMDELL